MNCDRCGCVIENWHPPEDGSMTAGYYYNWSLFMDEGEHYVCDDCAWKDPRYVAVYGSHS